MASFCRSLAKRRSVSDLNELLTIALLSMLAGGRTCVDMEDYGRVCEAWLREFMTLENGIPSHGGRLRNHANERLAHVRRAEIPRPARPWRGI